MIFAFVVFVLFNLNLHVFQPFISRLLPLISLCQVRVHDRRQFTVDLRVAWVVSGLQGLDLGLLFGIEGYGVLSRMELAWIYLINYQWGFLYYVDRLHWQDILVPRTENSLIWTIQIAFRSESLVINCIGFALIVKASLRILEMVAVGLVVKRIDLLFSIERILTNNLLELIIVPHSNQLGVSWNQLALPLLFVVWEVALEDSAVVEPLDSLAVF